MTKPHSNLLQRLDIKTLYSNYIVSSKSYFNYFTLPKSWLILKPCSTEMNRFFNGRLGQSEAIRVEHTKAAI